MCTDLKQISHVKVIHDFFLLGKEDDFCSQKRFVQQCDRKLPECNLESFKVPATPGREEMTITRIAPLASGISTLPTAEITLRL